MDVLFSTKKVITFFVEPLGIILLLFVIGLYFLYKSSHVKAKFFLSLSLFLLLFFSYPPVGNFLIQQLESQYTKYNYKDTNIEFIHVLGSGHHENNIWPLSSQIGNASLKRTLEGVTIYKKFNRSDIKLIFTGYAGPNNKTPNAEMNARIAQIMGINNYNIIINGKLKDTKEESIFTKSIVNSRPFILVTSASHMPRAIKLFKNSGLNPIAAPTDFKGNNISFLSLPNIRSLEKSKNAMHELLGITWAYLVR